jgi:phage-related minor tail protein
MQRYTAMRAPVNELQAILAKSTLTSAEVAKAEALLDASQASGIITAGELSEAFTALDAAKIKDIAVTEAQAVANKTVGLNAKAQGEIATSLSEVLAGNFGRLRRTGAAFANQAGLLTKLMSPMGLAIVGAAGAAVLLTKAFADGENEVSAYNKALILTGNYAGETAAQLQVMAKSVGENANVTQGAAAAVVAQVTQTGKFYGDQIKTVSEAALELQKATGQAVDKTIADFEKLGKDPVHGILDLNQSMHFLTQSTYDQITALVQRGQTDKAAQVAQDAYAEAVKSRAEKVQGSLGTLETAWNAITGAAKGAWDAMLDVGRPETIDDKIAAVQNKLAIARQELLTG